MNNMLTSEQTTLVASNLDGYDIDYTQLIAKQIHESILRSTTYIPFPIMIYRLRLAAKVEISHQIDPFVMALHTIDPNMIKADENPVVLQRAHVLPCSS